MITRRIKAVIFDMDGTLIDSSLDFDLIRSELGLPKGPILESLAKMPDADRHRCMDVIRRHEADAARQGTLYPHARETLEELEARRVPIGLMTRNSRESVNTLLDRLALSFDWVRTREDGEIKPSPVPVLEMCQSMGVESALTASVGDYVFDLQSARAAGALAVLIAHGDELPHFAEEADIVVRSLREIPRLLGD